MNRFHSFTAAVLVAGIVVGGTALAQGPRGGGPGRAGRIGGAGLAGGLSIASLNLTQAQQDLVRDIRERGRAESQPLQATAREAQAAQRKAIDAIPLNEALIRATTQAIVDAQADLAIQQARVQQEIFLALTPAQQEQVRTAQAAREERLQQDGQRRQRQ
jgi:Spy/CpxP family protein refolding chaperone